ncbi:MAG: FMN-binding protein [Spirochaetaceae bacterium]|jgi:major membrane immunogen (membrane-anchored lipoprotein)|nr:FMN-binding protein [Spirochaetaceae bacterium]
MRKKSCFPALVSLLAILASCSNSSARLRDGYYTAEMGEYDEYGWKEFMTICVNNRIISQVEFNAKDIGGLLKSWDMDYMKVMKAASGTYPNEYSRFFSAQFVADQNVDSIDALTGATDSRASFILLGRAVLESAKSGAASVVIVPVQTPAGTGARSE